MRRAKTTDETSTRDEPFRGRVADKEWCDLLDLGELPTVIETVSERRAVRLSGKGVKFDREVGSGGKCGRPSQRFIGAQP